MWSAFKDDPTTANDKRWKKFPSAVKPYPRPGIQTLESVNFNSPVDFNKKINWKSFLQDPESEIVNFALDEGIFEPVILAFLPHRYELFRSNDNLMPVLIDLRFDKKEIFYQLSRKIDNFRRYYEIKFNRHRHHISKFHLYAEVWDLRKGLPKKSFKEIARELKRAFPTVVSQFKKAFELLYGKPYESGDYKKRILAIIRKKTCTDCPERASCQPPGCPELIFELEMIEGKQQHKIFFDPKEQERSTIQLVSDDEEFRKWQEQEYE